MCIRDRTWALTRAFSTGTHDWEQQTLTLLPVKPIARMWVHCLFRGVPGTVWFDDAEVWILDDPKVRLFDGEAVELVEPSPPAGSIPSTDPARDQRLGQHGVLARSGDGIQLCGDPDTGRVAAVQVGKHTLPPGPIPGGIFLQDAARQGDVLRLTGPLRIEGSFATQRGEVRSLGLDVTAGWRSEDHRIVGRIEVHARQPVDRSLSLGVALPIRAIGWTWHDDIRRSRRIEADRSYANTARLGVGKTGTGSMYPLAAIHNDKVGLAIAVPLDEPRVFRLAYDGQQEWLYAAFDLAISPEPVKLPNRAHVDFELFTFEPTWGFRAALQRYYDLHPAYFVRRVQDTGLWMAFAKISQVRQPEDFGFYFKEGLDDQVYDNAHGILTFRYTEPQSHWLPMPKEMPRTYEAAVDLLARLSQKGDTTARRPHLAALASAAMKADGTYHVTLHNTPWCDGGVFALNPDPDLPGEFTKGRINYDPTEVEKLYADDPQHGIDGEYLDSLDGWCYEQNYRREHFKFADAPLVYDTETRRPCLLNAFSIWEFVRWVSQQVHARGKLMMANYTPTAYPWQVPHLDVMGQETNWHPGGQWSPMSDADLCYRRSLCATKPYLFLQNSDFGTWTATHTRWYMMRAGAYGIPPSFFSADAATHHYFQNPTWYERDRPIFRQLVPIIRRIGRAGWRPVPFARAEPESLQVERFGDPGSGELFLTVYNPDEKGVSGRLILLPDLKPSQVRELVSGQNLDVARSANEATLQITVPGREALFIHLTRES